MSRSYISSPPLHLHGVLWDCFSLFIINSHVKPQTLITVVIEYIHALNRIRCGLD
jgi:hypothetical protein